MQIPITRFHGEVTWAVKAHSNSRISLSCENGSGALSRLLHGVNSCQNTVCTLGSPNKKFDVPVNNRHVSEQNVFKQLSRDVTMISEAVKAWEKERLDSIVHTSLGNPCMTFI